MVRPKSWRVIPVLALVIGFSASAFAGTILHHPDDYYNSPDDYYFGNDQAHLDLGASPAYDCVGQVFGAVQMGSGVILFRASGTLIAPNWMLTGAHVLWPAPSYWDPEVPFGLAYMEYHVGDQVFCPTRYIPYPDFDWDPRSGHDIGLVGFSENIAELAGVEPAERYRGRKELGEVATFVGYGRVGTGQTGDLVADLKKRAGRNVIDAWWSTAAEAPVEGFSATARLLLSDFDNPDDPSASSMGESSPVELELLTSRGDSGGGVFIKGKKGEELLAGIQSIVYDPDEDDNLFANYGDVAGFTRVSAYQGWINKVLKSEPSPIASLGSDLLPAGAYAWQFAADAASVPEPSTLALLALAGLCLAGYRWRTGKPTGK